MIDRMPGANVTRSQVREIVLRTNSLSKRYKNRLVVDTLTLQVQRGDIFGFLGLNGAGKTTTIRMALGLVAPTTGSIEILGQDIATHRARVLSRVGALIETPALYSRMSGYDNLRAIGYTLGGVSKQQIASLLEMVGLRDRQRDRVRTYSLGMKQRLGVALALLHDPDLVMLDEPANGLDPAGIVEMRDLMQRLASAGKTIFISSHQLAEVQQMCTRVAIIHHGKLLTEASIEELTHGQEEFLVVVERAAEAIPLLQGQPWGRTARLDVNGAIITPAPGGRGRNVNHFLSRAGFVPDSITQVTQDLEQVFLRLTGGTQ